MADRDKLVCSKGHAGPAVYATLALKGFFPYEMLKNPQPARYQPAPPTVTATRRPAWT